MEDNFEMMSDQGPHVMCNVENVDELDSIAQPKLLQLEK